MYPTSIVCIGPSSFSLDFRHPNVGPSSFTQDFRRPCVLKLRECNKTGRWPALFLTLSLTLWRSLHYFSLLYITWGIIFYFSLHLCALWWQVVISLSRLPFGYQALLVFG